jgi:hypothetical protein
MEEENYISSDRDSLSCIKDLLIVQKFAPTKEIVEAIDLIIWQWIIEVLAKGKRNERKR